MTVRAKRDPVVAGGLDGREVAEADAVDPFDRQHVARGQVPVGLRHAEIRHRPWCFRRVRRRAAASRRRSISIGDRARERLDDLDRLAGAGHRAPGARTGARRRAWPAGRGRSASRRRAAAPSRRPTSSPSAVADARLVDLGDRGGGDRLAEFDEQTRRSGGRARPRPMRTPLPRGKGGMRSCSRSRSRAAATPTMSGRVARNWPNLT